MPSDVEAVESLKLLLTRALQKADEENLHSVGAYIQHALDLLTKANPIEPQI